MSKPLVQSTGRRKTAVARVRVRTGTGKISVNGRELANYFPSQVHQMHLSEPLRITETAEVYDVDSTVDGGGMSGQAGALRLGIARALIALDARHARCAEEAGHAHPRSSQERIEEVRPQKGPQSAAVQQALIRLFSGRPEFRPARPCLPGLAPMACAVGHTPNSILTSCASSARRRPRYSAARSF